MRFRFDFEGHEGRRPVTVDLADVPVAILAGGLATRLRPLTEPVPKALRRRRGPARSSTTSSPCCAGTGMRRVVLCAGHLGEQIEALRRRRRALRPGGRATRTTARRLLGHRRAPCAAPAAPRRRCFWVLYGDSYLDVDFGADRSAPSERSGASGS